MWRDIEKLKLKNKVLSNAIICYSIWEGYKLQDEPTIKFLEKMQELNIPVITCHTSGHGDRDCIKQVLDITRPNVVIPIHTEVPEAIKELTDKAVILKDMEIYEIKE